MRSLEPIDVIVLENQTHEGPVERRLADFPRLAAHIADRFVTTARYGNFEILERPPSALD